MIALNGDEVSFELVASDRGRAAPHEGIKDRVAFLCVRFDEVPQQLYGLLRRVWLPVTKTAQAQERDAHQ